MQGNQRNRRRGHSRPGSSVWAGQNVFLVDAPLDFQKKLLECPGRCINIGFLEQFSIEARNKIDFQVSVGEFRPTPVVVVSFLRCLTRRLSSKKSHSSRIGSRLIFKVKVLNELALAPVLENSFPE